jgi:hypothetical protein
MSNEIEDLKKQLAEVKRSRDKLKKAFFKLLDRHNELRDRAGFDNTIDCTYDWCEIAGVLDEYEE